MLAAPLIAEVLPGATRLSSLFVLPIEMCVWGGGALFIREAVRRGQLGWRHMLLLALALAVAEECVIQQTSLAPMVLQLKGQVYARAFGVNYVYLLWALVYEVVFVVLVPVHLVELLFPARRNTAWMSRGGVIAAAVLFVLGSLLAWFSWTQIARPKVFHVPAFNPPLAAVVIAFAVIGLCVYLALGQTRRGAASASAPRTPPSPWLLGTAGALWAILWYGLVLLGFGLMPTFPPAVAIASGLLLVALIWLLLPRWVASPRWSDHDRFAVIFGSVFGAMLVGFVGFIGAAPWDLYFKIIIDVVATGLLIALGLRLRQRADQN